MQNLACTDVAVMICPFYCVTAVDETPRMFDLLCMPYTGEDGKIIDFRLKDRLLRKWKDLAYALKFPTYVVDSMKQKDDPLDQLLVEWLQGANKTDDSRPITWGTLVAALHHANFQDEVNILKEQFVQVDTVATHSGELSVCICSVRQICSCLSM